MRSSTNIICVNVLFVEGRKEGVEKETKMSHWGAKPKKTDVIAVKKLIPPLDVEARREIAVTVAQAVADLKGENIGDITQATLEDAVTYIAAIIGEADAEAKGRFMAAINDTIQAETPEAREASMGRDQQRAQQQHEAEMRRREELRAASPQPQLPERPHREAAQQAVRELARAVVLNEEEDGAAPNRPQEMQAHQEEPKNEEIDVDEESKKSSATTTKRPAYHFRDPKTRMEAIEK